MLSYSAARPARRVAGHGASSVVHRTDSPIPAPGYAGGTAVRPRTWKAVGLAVLANVLLLLGAGVADVVSFTDLFLNVAVLAVALNALLFIRRWRRFQSRQYLAVICAVAFGVSFAFMGLIAAFGRRYFEFVL